MKVAVRYYSRSGNTKKLAEAIGKAVGVPAGTVDETLTGPVDLLFLGGAIYAGKIDEHVRRFVEALTPDQVKSVAVFSTTMGKKSAHPHIKESLDKKGIEVKELPFHCKGQFMLFNKGRPGEQDCIQAADYARKLVECD